MYGPKRSQAVQPTRGLSGTGDRPWQSVPRPMQKMPPQESSECTRQVEIPIQITPHAAGLPASSRQGTSARRLRKSRETRGIRLPCSRRVRRTSVVFRVFPRYAGPYPPGQDGLLVELCRQKMISAGDSFLRCKRIHFDFLLRGSQNVWSRPAPGPSPIPHSPSCSASLTSPSRSLGKRKLCATLTAQASHSRVRAARCRDSPAFHATTEHVSPASPVSAPRDTRGRSP